MADVNLLYPQAPQVFLPTWPSRACVIVCRSFLVLLLLFLFLFIYLTFLAATVCLLGGFRGGRKDLANIYLRGRMVWLGY